jgi:hypothetical protein
VVRRFGPAARHDDVATTSPHVSLVPTELASRRGVTNKTRGLCLADTRDGQDSGVMQALKISLPDEQPTRPFHARPIPRAELTTGPTHLMLVRAPGPTPRSLAWARQREGGQVVDSVRLESMLRLERLNLG